MSVRLCTFFNLALLELLQPHQPISSYYQKLSKFSETVKNGLNCQELSRNFKTVKFCQTVCETVKNHKTVRKNSFIGWTS